MAQTSEQARDSYVEGLEAKAGRPIDELVATVVGWGPGKHTELLKRAKEAFGLGHGHANLLIHLARDRMEAAAGAPPAPADPLDAIYAGSKAPLRPLHEAFMARLADLGPFEVAPKKANVSLRRSKQFALVGPGSKGRLEVGVNHRGADGPARFEALGPGKMCTHRTFVTAPEEIDEELLTFVRAAYEAAAEAPAVDLDAYRAAYFVDPPPEPRYAFTGAFGATLYVEAFTEAVAFYAAVLGPPSYMERDDTRGWPIGSGWLTLLRGRDGNPRNVELTFEVATVAEAERLQAACIAAGGRGSAPSDQLMYRPVRACPVTDPFGTELMIVAALPIASEGGSVR